MPTKVFLQLDDEFSESQQAVLPTIFAAKLQGNKALENQLLLTDFWPTDYQ